MMIKTIFVAALAAGLGLVSAAGPARAQDKRTLWFFCGADFKAANDPDVRVYFISNVFAATIPRNKVSAYTAAITASFGRDAKAALAKSKYTYAYSLAPYCFSSISRKTPDTQKQTILKSPPLRGARHAEAMLLGWKPTDVHVAGLHEDAPPRSTVLIVSDPDEKSETLRQTEAAHKRAAQRLQKAADTERKKTGAVTRKTNAEMDAVKKAQDARAKKNAGGCVSDGDHICATAQ